MMNTSIIINVVVSEFKKSLKVWHFFIKETLIWEDVLLDDLEVLREQTKWSNEVRELVKVTKLSRV